MSGLERLGGRVAVVTGGASGIGKGIARRLIARGVQVVIADIEEAVLAETASAIGATPIRTDVADRASVAALADDVMSRFGRVDIVCNNAGVGPLRSFDEFTLDDLDWVLSVNLWGVLHGTKAFLPHLRENPDGGWIVNTASMAGLITSPGMSAYSVTKFAVVALSEVLAQELAGSGVGISVLVPAQVQSNIAASERNRPRAANQAPPPDTDTGLLPPGRVLDADHVGDLVVEAITGGQLYIVTHPETLPLVQARQAAIESAFMRAAEKEKKA